MLHWDGKLLLKVTGNKYEDRIAILVSGNCQEKLVGIPKVTADTGAEMACVCLEYVQKHHLSERIRALSFDTTASNFI